MLVTVIMRGSPSGSVTPPIDRRIKEWFGGHTVWTGFAIAVAHSGGRFAFGFAVMNTSRTPFVSFATRFVDGLSNATKRPSAEIINDIKGPEYRKSYIPGYGSGPRYHRFDAAPSYLMRTIWPRYVSLYDLLHPTRGTYLYELDDNYFHNPPAWQVFTSELDRLAQIAHGRGVPAIVFLHSSLEYLNLFHPYRRIYDLVSKAARERGLIPVPSLDVFLGHDDESLWVGPGDPHPNAEGHRLLARALLPGIEGLDPAWMERSAARPGRDAAARQD